MKKTTTIFFVFFISLQTGIFAQAGLDKSFAGTGKITKAIGPGFDWATATAVQGDGKILVAGYATATANGDFIMLRYNSNGTLDTAFGDSGMVITDFGGSDLAFDVMVQPDGRILLAGQAQVGNNSDFAVARYKYNGTLDSSFGGDGKTTAAIGNYDDIGQAIALQKDGKILVAGYTLGIPNYDFALARFHTDGRLDSSFSADGRVVNMLGTNMDYANSVKVQANGKILVSGRFVRNAAYDIAVLRYNSDGSPDFDFGDVGVVVTSIGSTDDAGYAMAIQPDQKILVGGAANTGSYNDFAVVRYDTLGQLDKTFSGDGKQTIAVGAEHDIAYDMVLQPDGRIILGGTAKMGTYNEFALVRLNKDGSPDSTFDEDGKTTFAIGNNNDIMLAMALQADGKIIGAGVTHNGTNYDFALARYIPGNSSRINSQTIQGQVVSVYPNPTSGQVHVKYSLGQASNVKFYLYNIQGQMLTELTPIEQFSGDQDFLFRLPENAVPGTYMLHIASGEALSIVKVVVSGN